MSENVSPSLAGARIVDLFAGPGGLDVAAHWLGVPATGIEWDASACRTRRVAGLQTKQGDVRDFGPDDFPNATILAGGPPCQTYTVAGNGAGRRALDTVLSCIDRLGTGKDPGRLIAELDDERTGLVLEPLRWVLEAERRGAPYEAVILEQVPAVLPVWNAMAEVLAERGYEVVTGILRSEEFGVPQTRRRAIMLAVMGRSPSLPLPTHRPYRKGVSRESGDPRRTPWRTMGETLSVRDDFVVVSNYGSGGDPRARGRRTSDQPAATVTGKVFRNRVLDLNGIELPRFSANDAAQLQTFPRGYPWSGTDIAQQIGNAIPPRLAAHVLASALGVALDIESLDDVVDSAWALESRGRLTYGAIGQLAHLDTGNEVASRDDMLDFTDLQHLS